MTRMQDAQSPSAVASDHGASIDYYFAPASPWAYLGHERLQDIATSHGRQIEVIPVDLAEVFPSSGGLPLERRARSAKPIG